MREILFRDKRKERKMLKGIFECTFVNDLYDEGEPLVFERREKE